MSMTPCQESLVLISAAVAAGCKPCLETALGRAWESGAKPEEIARAAQLGKMVANHARTDMEKFAQETLGDYVLPETGVETGGGCGCACSAGKAV